MFSQNYAWNDSQLSKYSSPVCSKPLRLFRSMFSISIVPLWRSERRLKVDDVVHKNCQMHVYSLYSTHSTNSSSLTYEEFVESATRMLVYSLMKKVVVQYLLWSGWKIIENLESVWIARCLLLVSRSIITLTMRLFHPNHQILAWNLLTQLSNFWSLLSGLKVSLF